MMTDVGTAVRMPKLADTLVEGTVGRWLKSAGDAVSSGEPLVEIETDKVSTELTAPIGGVLTELVVGEGQTVPVGAVIARIGSGTGAPPSPVSPVPQRAGPPPRPTSVAARMLAEHGLSAGAVVEGAPARRVTKDDVRRYVEARAPHTLTREADRLGRTRGVPRSSGDPTSLAPSTFQPLTSMRRAIADHMTRARATIPHGQTVMDADLTELVGWRDRRKARFEDREGASLTFTVLFIAALARAARRLRPRLGLAPPTHHGRGAIDLGVAVALDGGLIVPVIRDVDALTLGDVARSVKDLAERARHGQLRPDETQGALMTVTNVGSFGNLAAFPIVPLGQVGILGPGLVERRPMPAPPGGVRQGWRCLLALVFDRRQLSDLAADQLLRGVLEELDQAHQSE